MTVLAVLAGLLIGLSLGALGGGGSILTVPALVYLLGMSAHQATAGSLIVVGIAAVVGAITHARAGRVAVKAGVVFGVLGTAGSYLGSRASAAVPSDVLLTGFGLLMLVAAAAMIARRRSGQPGEAGGEPGPAVTTPQSMMPNASGSAARDTPSGHIQGPAGHSGRAAPAAAGSGATTVTQEAPTVSGAAHKRSGLRQAAIITAAASGVGLITGFFGVGGGFVIVPVLILVLGFDMATAAGTSLLVIAIDSVASLASRFGHGAVSLDWAVIGLFTGAAVVGAVAGGRAAGRLNPQRLATAFIALIIVLAAYTLARSVPGLV